VPESVKLSMCSIPLTVVVAARSKIEVIRPSNSWAGGHCSPDGCDHRDVDLGIHVRRHPQNRHDARQDDEHGQHDEVYGRRRASRTIHIGLSSGLLAGDFAVPARMVQPRPALRYGASDDGAEGARLGCRPQVDMPDDHREEEAEGRIVQDVTRLPEPLAEDGWGYHIAMPVRSRPRAPVPAAQNSIFWPPLYLPTSVSSLRYWKYFNMPPA